MATTGAGEAVFLWEGVIRGHHIYKAVWTPTIGENLGVSREPGNLHDPRAVSILRSGTIVGHVPREHNRIFWHFLSHDGHISCEVIGARKLGKGLEVPCLYKFKGKEKHILKAKEIFTKKKLKLNSKLAN